MRPFHRSLGRHALDCLGVHIGDDVFGDRFGCGSVRRTGMTGITGRDLADILERQHDWVVLPHRVLLPILGRASTEPLLRGEPCAEYRLRAYPVKELFG